MKKVMMMALVAAALTACQSKANKNVDQEADSLAVASLPVSSVVEVYEGTLPATKGPGINYLLTLSESTDGVDTTYTLDMTYMDPQGTCGPKTHTSKGKKKTLHKTVNKQPKTAMQLTPDNGEAPLYFMVVNDTTLRLVNDSLQESISGIQYDIYRVK